MFVIRYWFVPLLLFSAMSSRLWSDVVPKVIVENISRPAGIAIQPETGHVFVAECGAGRISRIVDGQLQPVVVGLPPGAAEGGAASRVQPVGLDFIDRRTLVMSVSSDRDAQAALYIAEVPEPGAEPLSFDALLRLGPKTKESPAQSQIYGVAVSKSAIYVTESGEKSGGLIRQVDIKNLKDLSKAESFGPWTRFISTEDTAGIGTPAGITLSARGEIVVGQLGAFDQSRDSHLSFYRSTDGRLLLNLETGLHDIVAVEYGAPKPPSNKANLYVLDLALSSPEMGGLYRLDAEYRDGKQGVKAVRIAPLDRPTDMALSNDGSIYVTVLGLAGGADGSGKVVQFEPGL